MDRIKEAYMSDPWDKEEVIETFRWQCGYYPLEESTYGPGVIKKMEGRIREVMSMAPGDSFVQADLHFVNRDSFEVKQTRGKGQGLFALKKIYQGDNVGEYVGVHTIEEPEDESDYVIQTELGIFIDAKKYGTYTRFINHGCKPNLVTDVVYDKGRIKLVFLAKRDINVGEELTYYYQDVTCKRQKTRCMCVPSCRYVIGSTEVQNTGKPAHKCQHCDMPFQFKSLLERHLYIHSTDQTFKCSICDRAFKQDSALKRHEKTHQQRYVCHLCKKKKATFTRVDTFNRHLMSTHGVAKMTKEELAECLETINTTLDTAKNEEVLTENVRAAKSKQLKRKKSQSTRCKNKKKSTRSKSKGKELIDDDSTSFDEGDSTDEENRAPISRPRPHKKEANAAGSSSVRRAGLRPRKTPSCSEASTETVSSSEETPDVSFSDLATLANISDEVRSQMDSAETTAPLNETSDISTSDLVNSAADVNEGGVFHGLKFFLTTNSGDPNTISLKDEYYNIIGSNGGEVLDSVDGTTENVFLVADTYVKTVKYMYCLAAGIPTISYDWIKKCVEENALVDCSSFALPGGWSLETKSVVARHQRKPFTDYKIFHEFQFEQNYEHWEPVLRVAGAKLLEATEEEPDKIPTGTDVVVIDVADPEPSLIMEAESLNVPVVYPEWLVQSLILGERANLNAPYVLLPRPNCQDS